MTRKGMTNRRRGPKVNYCPVGHVQHLARWIRARLHAEQTERQLMAGPVEILIVLGVFGLMAIYLYIVSRFIHESEEPAASPRELAKAEEPEPSGFAGRTAHAH
jgi:hypothetical protein